MIAVCSFEQDNMGEYPFWADVPVGIYEGFAISVQKIEMSVDHEADM